MDTRLRDNASPVTTALHNGVPVICVSGEIDMSDEHAVFDRQRRLLHAIVVWQDGALGDREAGRALEHLVDRRRCVSSPRYDCPQRALQCRSCWSTCAPTDPKWGLVLQQRQVTTTFPLTSSA